MITAWLDWAMCLVWFGGALFFSSRLISILTYFFNAGGAPIQPALFNLLRQGWMAVLAGVTVAFVVNAWETGTAGCASQSHQGSDDGVKFRTLVVRDDQRKQFACRSASLRDYPRRSIQRSCLGLQRAENQRTAASRVEKFLFGWRCASFAAAFDSGLRRRCRCTRLRSCAGSKRASTQREFGQLLDWSFHGFNLPPLLFRWLYLAGARERFPAEHRHRK